MTKHQRRPGETVAQERARLHRQDTVAGRAAKRRNVSRTTTGRKRPTLPSQASPKARAAVAKTRPPLRVRPLRRRR